MHAVSGFLSQQQCNILASAQFFDPATGLFFMRLSFDPGSKENSCAALKEKFHAITQFFSMSASFKYEANKTKTLILVSQHRHCLNDLLFRTNSNALNIDIKAVVSNHQTFENLITNYHHPFHYLPSTLTNKKILKMQLIKSLQRMA